MLSAVLSNILPSPTGSDQNHFCQIIVHTLKLLVQRLVRGALVRSTCNTDLIPVRQGGRRGSVGMFSVTRHCESFLYDSAGINSY
jgi:hypothetical protein